MEDSGLDYENEKKIFGEALEMKDKLGLPSVDTALLIMISQDLDQLIFHNSD